MSEYQYYEFQAIDRSLDEADRQALRALSSRARISATRFVNTYDFGDFGGNPLAMMERWFDLYLYLANWGTRRLMMRLPGRPIDRSSVDTFLRHVDCAETTVAGDHWILSVSFHDEEGDWDEAPFDDCDDADWLAAIAPLRADVIGGDLRLFYLLWLMAVEDGSLPDHELEPLPGLGPLTGALEAFAAFFYIDSVLVAAAAEQRADPALTTPQASAQVRSVIAAMPDQEKSRLLAALFDDDPHAGSELKALVRTLIEQSAAPAMPRRTAGAFGAAPMRSGWNASGRLRKGRPQNESASKRKRCRRGGSD